MKIIEEYCEGDEYGDGEYLEVKVETSTGKMSVCFGNGEPEDATLSRDLNDAHSIKDLLKLAYEAGKRGEDLEIVEETISSDEEE